MDNITHSILGLAAGEAVAVRRPQNRAPLWIASVLANNIPDIDVPLDSWLMPDPLSRLLYHRGYTHTFLLAPLQGLLVFFLIRFFYRREKELSWRALLFVSLLGPFLHIFADSWNSYGVHPFWPFNNEWYYGDAVFILEPWIWVIFLPVLIFASPSKILRTVFSLIVAGALALAWASAMVPALVAGLLTAAALLGLILAKITSSAGKRLAFATIGFAIFLATFTFTSHSLAKRLGSVGTELALSPYHGNPFCWSAVAARFEGEEYRAESFRLAPWPSIFPVQRCPAGFTESPHLRKTEAVPFDEKMSLGIFTAPRSELTEISRHCRGEAFLRFARIPFWQKENDSWLIGDLRFDRGRARGFAQTTLEAGCLPTLPPWKGPFSP